VPVPEGLDLDAWINEPEEEEEEEESEEEERPQGQVFVRDEPRRRALPEPTEQVTCSNGVCYLTSSLPRR
jgi:AP-3 complex subunit delta-1